MSGPYLVQIQGRVPSNQPEGRQKAYQGPHTDIILTLGIVIVNFFFKFLSFFLSFFMGISLSVVQIGSQYLVTAI